MNERRAILISNPNAGRGGERREREVERFCQWLKARGVQVEVLSTTGPNDATRLAARAVLEGAREIIVSGGDGTINEALQGLVGTGVRIGIWPRGTANVLARELKIPLNMTGAAEVIANGKVSAVHVGCALVEETGERRYFFLMAGIGLDASVVRHVRPNLKRHVGEAAFWYAGLGHLAHWQPVAFSVEIEGESFPATFAAIGNAAHYGGNLAITPRAHLGQPEFEVCLVDSQSRLHYLYLLTHAMRDRGVSPQTRGVRFIRTKRTRVCGGDALVQVDGELIGRLPMSFEIAPGAVEIFTPESNG
jgi:diacylglycerol kinase (ATP)